MDNLSIIKQPIATELDEFIALFNQAMTHSDGMLSSALSFSINFLYSFSVRFFFASIELTIFINIVQSDNFSEFFHIILDCKLHFLKFYIIQILSRESILNNSEIL